MRLHTKAATRHGGTGFLVVLHKGFLDARKNMHLAHKAEGMSEFLLEERVKARNKVNTAFTKLSKAAKEGELSPSLFKDLNDAQTSLQEQDALLKEAEAKFEAAKQKSAAKSASFQKATVHCERAGCPQFHGARDKIPEPSKEETMAQKQAKEEQERRWYEEAQARAAEKKRMDDAEKEEEKARKAAKWQRMKEEYQKAQATKKRRREEYERENPPNRSRNGSKPWSEDSDEPNSKKRRPTAPQSSPAANPVASSSKHQEWILAVKEAFKDYTTLSSFPSPPASACSKPTCKSETRAFTACACDIRRSLHHLSSSQLKHFRLLFHPDKFSKCRQDLVESFQKQASAVFVVAEAMYRAKK
ncbi:hypothetical protein MBLNU13_g01097t1 [Cladosporium sp. NU13]